MYIHMYICIFHTYTHILYLLYILCVYIYKCMHMLCTIGYYRYVLVCVCIMCICILLFLFLWRTLAHTITGDIHVVKSRGHFQSSPYLAFQWHFSPIMVLQLPFSYDS